VKTALLSAVGAFALAAVAFSGGAQAQCWWSGYSWSCAPPVTPYAQPYAAYPAWNAWDYQDYRQRPAWLPSYPGPKPSGGGGGF
jgi:hypothetical protein